MSSETVVKRRLKRGRRREVILDMAMELFAENGFSVSTRDIASKLGVTQALLYKYFDSKEELIDAVLDERFGDNSPFPVADFSDPDNLSDALAKAYVNYFKSHDKMNVRLAYWAFLSGYEHKVSRATFFTEGIIVQTVGMLRAKNDLPGFYDRYLSASEHELIHGLQGSVSFMIARSYILNAAPSIEPEDAIRMHVETWLEGASRQIKRIHDQWSDQTEVPDRLRAGYARNKVTAS